MFTVQLDFAAYRPKFEFEFTNDGQLIAPTALEYAQKVKDGFMLWANPSPMKVSKGMPKMAPCIIPAYIRFLHVQRCGCKQGKCSTILGLKEIDAKTIGALWTVWKDKGHDAQIGKWLDFNDGVFLKLKPISQLPPVSSSCGSSSSSAPPSTGVQLRPGIAYVAFYLAP